MSNEHLVILTVTSSLTSLKLMVSRARLLSNI